MRKLLVEADAGKQNHLKLVVIVEDDDDTFLGWEGFVAKVDKYFNANETFLCFIAKNLAVDS